MEFMALWLVLAVFAALLAGYPVAFTLGGVSLLFAIGGAWAGIFNFSYLYALPNTLYGTMTSDLLIAVPLFIFMGIVLERSGIAEELLDSMSRLFGTMKGGLSVSVLLVGALLAASTGIVGATVVTMGLISLPIMLKNGYCKRLSTGTICAAGTLGQIIPPSIVLILLADQMSSAWQMTQLSQGVTSPEPVTIADMFIAALIPGIALVIAYIIWQWVYAAFRPASVPAAGKLVRAEGESLQALMLRTVRVMLPPLALIAVVLGTILGGVATATESAAIGAMGALLLSWCKRTLSYTSLKEVMDGTLQMSCMVFTILTGATVFTLVFRGYQGDVLVQEWLAGLPGGLFTVMLLTMLLMFILGFFLDFIQIIYVVVPIIAPVLLGLGADPVWLAIMMAVNLQTSFLTPPFGFALFYLRGVAPPEVRTMDIYRGVVPFIIIQLLMLIAIAWQPALATWLPKEVYGTDFSESLPLEPVIMRSHFEDDAKSWEINY